MNDPLKPSQWVSDKVSAFLCLFVSFSSVSATNPPFVLEHVSACFSPSKSGSSLPSSLPTFASSSSESLTDHSLDLHQALIMSRSQHTLCNWTHWDPSQSGYLGLPSPPSHHFHLLPYPAYLVLQLLLLLTCIMWTDFATCTINCGATMLHSWCDIPVDSINIILGVVKDCVTSSEHAVLLWLVVPHFNMLICSFWDTFSR